MAGNQQRNYTAAEKCDALGSGQELLDLDDGDSEITFDCGRASRLDDPLRSRHRPAALPMHALTETKQVV